MPQKNTTTMQHTLMHVFFETERKKQWLSMGETSETAETLQQNEKLYGRMNGSVKLAKRDF